MKFLLVCLLAIQLLSLTFAQDGLDEWEKWKEQNKKEYSKARAIDGQSQDDIRYGFFKNNLNKIKNHNSKNGSYKLGLNEFSDLSDEELNSRFNVKLDQDKIKQNIKSANISSTRGRVAVDTVNWVTAGYVAPVQNQGSCGSCYAFSTIAELESAHAIRFGLRFATRSFSAQQLLDCSFYRYRINGIVGNLGCNGGYDYHTLYYATQFGIQLAADYPYTGRVGSCRYSSARVVARNYGIYTASYSIGDVNALKNIVARQPVMVYMYVMNDFYNYKSGIYTGPNCRSSTTSCPLGINHAVTIVGYGSENGVPYWIVKNSWGTTWGENGYFRIAMGRNTCCIEGYSYYTLF